VTQVQRSHDAGLIVLGYVSATDLQNAVALSTARNAGYVYITPNGEPNPYGALPPDDVL
jgi:hypothetical protein